MSTKIFIFLISPHPCVAKIKNHPEGWLKLDIFFHTADVGFFKVYHILTDPDDLLAPFLLTQTVELLVQVKDAHVGSVYHQFGDVGRGGVEHGVHGHADAGGNLAVTLLTLRTLTHLFKMFFGDAGEVAVTVHMERHIVAQFLVLHLGHQPCDGIKADVTAFVEIAVKFQIVHFGYLSASFLLLLCDKNAKLILRPLIFRYFCAILCAIPKHWHIIERSDIVQRQKLYRLALTALFAALCCVATLVIQIPAPVTGGYMNLGDCFVLLSAFCLSPFSGALAAGIGSALADLLLGYAQYVPGTFVIKALMALSVGLFCRAFLKKDGHAVRNWVTRALAATLAEGLMAVGYFVYEATLLGYGLGALASMPLNLAQGGIGLVLALPLVGLLRRIPSVRHGLSEFNR